MAIGNLIIRQFKRDDFIEVKRIYQLGIDTNNATFEIKAPNLGSRSGKKV